MRILAWLLLLTVSALSEVVYAQGGYFQQEVNYNIHVRLDDKNHFLHASWTLDYTNNSPHTLGEIYMHLWPNAYSNRETAFGKQKLEDGSLRFYNASDEDRGYIDSLSFKANGESVWWNQVGDDPDVIKIGLPQPLAPGETVRLTTPFRVKIPKSFSRLGHVGQQYQLTQWYPKPAVYDQTGWHPMPYLDQGEFYSEYGSFDVYITLPANYVVGATGDLPEGSPEYDFLARREALTRKRIAEQNWVPGRVEEEYPESEVKILHFHQEKVHDFAWFCDKNYYVLTDTVILPDSKREVRCVSMFTSRHFENWRESAEYVKRSVHDYSLWNGDYPYNHATAVDGALSAGAGMEYPNITVVSGGGGPKALDNVIAHEVGHNWFYGILGSNERDYPWMDEGLNSYMEWRYMNKYYPDHSGFLGAAPSNFLGIDDTDVKLAQVANEQASREGLEQPIQLHSAEYTGSNYGVIVYMKTALAFRYLESYLGKDVIDQCFHTYYDRWKFRHPQPGSIREVFEEVSGKRLGWFFDGLLKGTNKIDFKLGKVSNGEVVVLNRSGIPLPAPVTLLDKEGKEIRTYWTKPFVGRETLKIPESYHALQVYREDNVPDIRPGNNEKNAKGMFKGRNPLSIHFPFKYPKATRKDIQFMPVLGGNTGDGFMLGGLIHKGYFPTDHFRFHIMPMYGFRSNRLTGSAAFALRWLPEKAFRKIELRVAGSSFSNLVRSKQSLVLYPEIKDLRNGMRHRIALESHILGDRDLESGDVTPGDWYLPVFGRATWEMRGGNKLYDVHLRGEAGGSVAEEVLRASGALYYRRKFGKKKKMYARGRLFAGAITSPNVPSGSTPTLLRYGLAGSGDPFGENIMFDRIGSSNFLSRQIFTDHGGFASNIPAAFDRALFSMNLAVSTPALLEVYGEGAYGKMADSDGETYYSAGLRLPLFSDAIRINVPLVGTVYDSVPESWNELGQNITFTFEPLRFVEAVGWKFFDIR